MADDLDVWDDAVDVDLELAARTQRKLHEMRLKTSYTDAAAASRDQGLQAGFEQGMDDARATAMRAGRLHGIICSSLIHLTTIATTPTALVDELQSIYEQLYSLADGAQAGEVAAAVLAQSNTSPSNPNSNSCSQQSTASSPANDVTCASEACCANRGCEQDISVFSFSGDGVDTDGNLINYDRVFAGDLQHFPSNP